MFPEPDNELEAGDERLRRQTRSLPSGKPQPGASRAGQGTAVDGSHGSISEQGDLRTQEKQHGEQRKKLPEEKVPMLCPEGQEGL